VPPVRLTQCPSCEEGLVLSASGSENLIECWRCRYRFRGGDARAFGRREWDDWRMPALVLGCLRAMGLGLHAPESRLACCAVARFGFAWCKNVWFRWAVEGAEEWADTGKPKPGVDDVRRRLRDRPTRRRTNDRDWVELGLCCTSERAEPYLPNFRA